MTAGDSSALFNPKTIGRLCSGVKIAPAQRKAAFEWLNLLKSNKLEEEKTNYPIFMKIILEQLLSYPIEELVYEKGDIEFQFSNSAGKKLLGIEAKGTATKDLFARQYRDKKEQETPIMQTWSYIGKNDLNYGICTNYRDFVLIDRSKGLTKFHVFDFTQIEGNDAKLREFIAIFSKESIIDKKFLESLYDASIIEEREFTREFYKLFHETRLMLIKEFQNLGLSRERALHFAQLFLNRLTFVFFAEDTGKLPSRTFAGRMLKVLDAMTVNEYSKYASETISALFESLDKGAETPTHIFGFNGGLFQEPIPPIVYFTDLRDEKFFNEIYQHSELKKEVKLDELSQGIVNKYRRRLNPIISNLLAMRSFDFATELNVNILGHIFEQSLTDLEELKGETVSKRKEEGIFYTPEFVTDYICRNTIIPCLSKSGSRNTAELINEYLDNIEELESKFRAIKILDPACGSGGFLLKAVDILLEIYKEIQLFKQFKGHYTAVSKRKKSVETSQQLTLTKWNEEAEARKIIENNIFGVDVNEESAEIAKLSLFLKIATTNRKLIDLSRNIMVGNSLIEDPTIVGEKAFKWSTNFREILSKGGFDIIVTNPPYIPIERMSEPEKTYYAANFDGVFRKYDSSVLFVESVLRITKPGALLGFIMPLTWQTGDNYLQFRRMLFAQQKVVLRNLVNLPFDVFPDAYVDTGIAIFAKHSLKVPYLAYGYEKDDRINSIDDSQAELVSPERILKDQDLKVFADNATYEILDKVRKDSVELGTITDSAQGIVTSKFPVSDVKKYETYLPFLIAADANRYRFHKEKTAFIDFTKASNILPLYTNPKIMLRRIVNRQNRLMAFYDDSGIITNKDYNPFRLISQDYDVYYVLALLNSKLFSFLYTAKSSLAMKDDFRQTTLAELRKLPIKKVSNDIQKRLADLAMRLSDITERYFEIKNRLMRRIEGNFGITVTGKLRDVTLLTFQDFKHEIELLSMRKLSVVEQDEWESYFTENTSALTEVRNEIISADNQIDELVNEIYDITENERRLIDERVLEPRL